MDDIRNTASCVNALKKGECDERIFELYIWKEVKPNNPIKLRGPKEEQAELDICKDCNNFSAKES